MTIIMILLAVAGGAMLSIQAAINGQLGSKVGVFKIFAVGIDRLCGADSA